MEIRERSKWRPYVTLRDEAMGCNFTRKIHLDPGRGGVIQQVSKSSKQICPAELAKAISPFVNVRPDLGNPQANILPIQAKKDPRPRRNKFLFLEFPDWSKISNGRRRKFIVANMWEHVKRFSLSVSHPSSSRMGRKA